MTKCKCGNPMANHAHMCARCRQDFVQYLPSPEEIARLKHEIRWGLVVIVNDRSKSPRKFSSGRPSGGVLCLSDDDERAWRRGQVIEECEVDDD